MGIVSKLELGVTLRLVLVDLKRVCTLDHRLPGLQMGLCHFAGSNHVPLQRRSEEIAQVDTCLPEMKGSD